MKRSMRVVVTAAGCVASSAFAQDARGPFGESLDAAESLAFANEYDRAIAVCRDVLRDAAGTPDETEAGCEALSLIGLAYQRRGWVEEASLAYQTAVDLHPKAMRASEALVRALDCYAAAQRAGRRRYYKEHIRADTNRLIRDYPDDPRAGNIGCTMGEAADPLTAIEILETVQPTADQYTRARLMIGVNYFQHLSKLEADGEFDEAEAFYPLAEIAFEEAIAAILVAKNKATDPKIQAALDGQEYLARLSLARVLIRLGSERIADATAAIGILEAKWGDDSQKAPDVRQLRVRLLNSRGGFDESGKWIGALHAKDRLAAAPVAGQLARALDRAGLDRLTADPNSTDVEGLWRHAASFYWMSVEPQIESAAIADAGELIDVGNRFVAYARRFNDVPDSRVSFVGPRQLVLTEPEHFRRAAATFEAALAIEPEYRTSIQLGRAYGFLGEWTKAAQTYARLFEGAPIVDAKRPGRIDAKAVRARPELVFASLEWAVAERRAFEIDGDARRLTRSLRTILTPLRAWLKPDASPLAFWAASYELALALALNGEFMEATLSIEDLQRNVSPDFDGDPDGYLPFFVILKINLRR